MTRIREEEVLDLFLVSPFIFSSFSDLYVNTQKNSGTDYRNFDLNIFGEFFKFTFGLSV